MDNLELDMTLYKVFGFMSGIKLDSTVYPERLPSTMEVVSQTEFLAFVRRITNNDLIQLKDVSPIFARLDAERTGILDWPNFKNSFRKLTKDSAADISFILLNESGFDKVKEELLYLTFINCLLVDYEATFPLFEALSQKLPLPSILRRETDLIKALENEVGDRNALFKDAQFYLGDFTLIANAINSFNNKQGLSRLNKVLLLLDLLDHPKDFVFISGFFKSFYESYAKNQLFHQTFNLLKSTTEPECMLEVGKILFHMYNSLKICNHNFNFRNLLDRERLNDLFLGENTIKELLDITTKTSNQLFEVFVLILVSIVKYTDREYLPISDPDYLTIIFLKLDTELNVDSYSALALLAYTLALKATQINETNPASIDVLIRTGLKLTTMGSAELFVYGIRVYGLLLPYHSPGGDFIQLFTKIEPILQGQDEVFQAETLKFIRCAARLEKFAGIILENQIVMEYVKTKVFDGDSCFGILAAQVLWSLSISNYSLVLVERKIHSVVIKALENNKRNTLDLLIIAKSFVSNKLATTILVQENLIPTLFGLMVQYREKEPEGAVFAPLGEQTNLVKLNLCLDMIRMIFSSGFMKGTDGANLYAEIVLALNLDRFKDFLEMLCQDKLAVVKSLKSPFMTYLTEKNITENIACLCNDMKRIFAFSNQNQKINFIENLERSTSNAFNEIGDARYLSSPQSPSKQNYTVYFKTFSLNNYPLGDNREFKIEGSHGIDRVMIMLNQKYSYMGPFIPLYKNKQQEVITLDSDELYNKILFEVFNDKFRRDAEVVLYIKPMNATIDQKVFNNLIFKEVACTVCNTKVQNPVNYNPLVNFKCSSCDLNSRRKFF